MIKVGIIGGTGYTGVGLVGILLTGVCGYVLDGIWSDASRPMPGE